jgi:hypothetical protein
MVLVWKNATDTWTVYPQKQFRRGLITDTFERKFCNILWYTFLSNSLYLNTVSSLEHTALQFEGAKPLQFVSWWNIFMQKSALSLLAAVPPISTWLQHEQQCLTCSASIEAHFISSHSKPLHKDIPGKIFDLGGKLT